MAVEGEARTEERDYYEVLGAQPSATSVELRAAFRDAVLRHHPDRATASQLATRRTAVLNRAWRELRDPLRRLHYDHDLERGTRTVFGRQGEALSQADRDAFDHHFRQHPLVRFHGAHPRGPTQRISDDG